MGGLSFSSDTVKVKKGKDVTRAQTILVNKLLRQQPTLDKPLEADWQDSRSIAAWLTKTLETIRAENTEQYLPEGSIADISDDIAREVRTEINREMLSGIL